MDNTGWLNFPLFYWMILIGWLLGMLTLAVSYFSKKWIWGALVLLIISWLGLLYFDVGLWIALERPPMRTLGETRLWYSTFLPLIGFVTYFRWQYKWFLAYCIGMAMLFLTINYLNPETYSKTLMPALQSIWFIPHVLVYLLAYAFLAASSTVAIKGLYEWYNKRPIRNTLALADNLVFIGFAFLTLGLLFGALWAKEAWGHYWTWDPKETWAFLTWMAYLIYIHFRHYHPGRSKAAFIVLSIAFLILLICWFGVNYLPVAANSVHTYTQ